MIQLIRKRLKTESGYTLVEVMASIILLSFAILPMAGMFDMGIEGATAGSNYDKARTLANLKLEEAKSLPFDSTDNAVQDLKDNFPMPAGTMTMYDGGEYQSGPMEDSDADYWDDPDDPTDFTNFEYKIEKQYMAKPPADSEDDPALASQDWSPDTSDTPTDLIRVTVTVRWADGNEYTTFGLVAR